MYVEGNLHKVPVRTMGHNEAQKKKKKRASMLLHDQPAYPYLHNIIREQ